MTSQCRWSVKKNAAHSAICWITELVCVATQRKKSCPAMGSAPNSVGNDTMQTHTKSWPLAEKQLLRVSVPYRKNGRCVVDSAGLDTDEAWLGQNF